MALRTDFTDGLKTAMKAGDAPRVSTLRMVMARLKDLDIAARPKGVAQIPDDEIVSMLRNMVKSRAESAAMYVQGGRPELAAKEDCRDRHHRAVPAGADGRGGAGARGRRRRRRDRRRQHEGHGPGDGGAEGQARRGARSRPGERAGEGEAELDRPGLCPGPAKGRRPWNPSYQAVSKGGPLAGSRGRAPGLPTVQEHHGVRPRLPRRAARPHPDRGGDRPQDQAGPVRPAVQGVLPVPRREDALLLRL